MITLFTGLLAAAVILALGLVATLVLGKRSAALRHAILTTAIVTACLMPALKYALPQVPLIAWNSSSAVVSSSVTFGSGNTASQSAVRSVADAGRAFPWAEVFLIIWILGALVIAAGVLTGLVRLSRLRARCLPVMSGRWRELADGLARECRIRRPVMLLQSDDPALLVTCGVLKPSIILPAGATAWPDDRCRSVLRHELAHISRHDAAVQVLGEVLRILQWINPLAWVACRRLRHESEYACDDAVLSGGIAATDYATHLLEVARHVSARRTVWASAPAIAESSTLERRIVAMLHERRNRRPLGQRGWLITAVVALGIGVPLGAAGVAPAEAPAAFTPAHDVMLPSAPPAPTIATTPASSTHSPASPARPRAITHRQAAGSVTGTIIDQLAGTLPDVSVTLSDGSGAQLATTTNAAGAFAFQGVQPGQYQLRGTVPGFVAFISNITVTSGAAVDRTITLQVGTLQESVTVSCSATAQLAANLRALATSLGEDIVPVLSAHEAGSQVQVGGNVRPPIKLQDVKPVCPADAPQGDTIVRLVGHINEDGLILDAASGEAQDSGAPPADLVNAAINAVRQWRFSPTLLDRQPISVLMTVTVTFTK